MCGVSLLKLFLAFAVAFHLFSELAVKEVTAGATALFTIQAESIEKEGYLSVILLFDLTPLPRTVQTIPRYLLSVMIAG